MCKLKNEFLLCTCLVDNLNDNDVGWILFRRKENKKREPWANSQPIPDSFMIGSRELPNNEISFEYKELYDQCLKKLQEREKRETELKKLRDTEKETQYFLNITAHILTQLNHRNCFDKEINIVDKDVLSIKLNNELELWVEFIFRKHSWKLAKFNLNKPKYLKIITGKIRSTHNDI
ncbi:hypothetical protein [uncultured Dokdonia sp.]|uniref:hypothetical protein n=1 Tax=uncultured Dokdonia sp. TaxID=575653 RepID=UPI00260D2141|nr:hypothetical protein [uncultured Dokdonia sp.]